MAKRDVVTPTRLPKFVYAVVSDGWRQLTKSRNTIICEFYVGLAKSKGMTLDRTVSASEARERCCGSRAMPLGSTDVGLDSLESKLVLASRISAAWMVLWTSFLPLAAVALWVAHRWTSVPDRNVILIVCTCTIAIVLFFVAAFFGLLIQAIFVRPFLAFVNWFVGLPDVAI